MSAIQIANNHFFHNRKKYTQVDCHYIRELLHQGVITLSHIKTKHQFVGIFTKAKERDRHEFLLDKLMFMSPWSKLSYYANRYNHYIID
ncbi:hypothetical protein DsansV1_C09g0096651 [Dioscorea sansibarensis]